MKKKKVALKSLKLDKAHLLNLNAIEGGRGVDGKSIIKLTTDDSILPTGPTNPTNATWCFFCPPNQSVDRLCF